MRSHISHSLIDHLPCHYKVWSKVRLRLTSLTRTFYPLAASGSAAASLSPRPRRHPQPRHLHRRRLLGEVGHVYDVEPHGEVWDHGGVWDHGEVGHGVGLHHLRRRQRRPLLDHRLRRRLSSCARRAASAPWTSGAAASGRTSGKT